MMKKLLLIVLLSLCVQVLKAITIVAVPAGGVWDQPSTWSPAQVPGCGDLIIINAGTTVTVNGQIDFSGCATPMGVLIYGTLYFKAGKLHLPVGSGVYLGPGAILDSKTGGLSSRIDIGSVTMWYGGLGMTIGPKIYGIDYSTLPVELLSFDAKCNDRVIITWSTATETNNDHFTLERSVDSKNWDIVATFKGAGSSNTLLNYQYTDEKSFGGISYYRLSQTDYDGKSEIFSPVAVVCSSAKTDDIIMYPNPFKEELKIQYSNLKEGSAEFKVYDIMGNIVLNRVIEVSDGSNYYILDLHEITNGLYTVEFTSGDTRYHQKVLKN